MTRPVIFCREATEGGPALLLGEGITSDSDESYGGLGVAKVLNFMNMNHLPHAIFGRQTPRSAEPAPEPVRVVTITKALSKHARRTVSGKEVEGKAQEGLALVGEAVKEMEEVGKEVDKDLH